jgi:hypothetical protein
VNPNPVGGDQKSRSPRPPHDRKPSLRPTSPASLVVALLAAAAIGWILIARDYGAFPTLTWLPTIVTGGLGALELAAAITTKARIDRKPGTVPVEPLLVVRFVLLAKASSLVGALFAGFFGSIAVWLFADRTSLAAAARDLPPALGGFGGAVLLLIAGLVLERACRVPPQPEDDDDNQD